MNIANIPVSDGELKFIVEQIKCSREPVSVLREFLIRYWYMCNDQAAKR